MKYLNALSGYKTYIVALLVALNAIAHYQLGWYPYDVMVEVMLLLGAGGLATLRSGIKSDTN